jgi:hypothetical protein
MHEYKNCTVSTHSDGRSMVGWDEKQ